MQRRARDHPSLVGATLVARTPRHETPRISAMKRRSATSAPSITNHSTVAPASRAISHRIRRNPLSRISPARYTPFIEVQLKLFNESLA
jgi:hypothetical protein